AIILMALQPSDVAWQQNWWWIVGSPFLVYFIDRALDDYVLTPVIQRHHTEMAIPTILFASLAGGMLGCVYGLLIAIPVAARVRAAFGSARIEVDTNRPHFRQYGGRRSDVVDARFD